MKTKFKILSFQLFTFILLLIGINNVYASDRCIANSKKANTYTYYIDTAGYYNNTPNAINLRNVFNACGISYNTISSYSSSNNYYVKSVLTTGGQMPLYNTDKITDLAREKVTVKYTDGTQAGEKSANITFTFKVSHNNIDCVGRAIQVKSDNTTTSANYEARTDLTKCTTDDFSKVSNVKVTSNNPNHLSVIAGSKIEFKNLSDVEDGDKDSLNIEYDYKNQHYKYKITYTYKKSSTWAPTLSYVNDITSKVKSGDYTLKQSEIKKDVKTQLAASLSTSVNKISDSNITWVSFSNVAAGSFVENLSDGSYKVVKTRTDKLSQNTDTNFTVNFKYQGKNYKLTYTLRYVKDASSSGGNQTTPETAKCYYNKEMQVYAFITPSEAAKGNYELYRDANGQEITDKNTCIATNPQPEPSPDVDTDSSSSGSSGSSSNSGKNTCTVFKVARERSYNCNESTGACPKLKNMGANYSDSYFKPVVAGLNSYYYVYKAYYNCEGADSATPITSFCVDPGLQGPKVKQEGYNNYHATATELDKNSKFYKGLYRLYTQWFREKYDYVAGKYVGTSPNGKEDFVDFIMDNVSRKLRMEYDLANADYLVTAGRTLVNEYNAYKNYSLGSGTNNVANSLVKEIWEDVTNFIANGSIDSGKSSSYTMPIAHFDYIVGDFDGKTSTQGYYCGLTSNHHRNPDGTIYKEHFGNSNYKHNGIDFVASTGTKVYAATSGTIVKVYDDMPENCYGKPACNNSTYKVGLGYKVLNDDGTYSLYMHMSKLYKTKNQRVSLGEEIGEVGATGEAQAAHLHYEMRKAPGELGYAINARAYLPMDNIETCAIDSWTKTANDTATITNSNSSANIKFSADLVGTASKINSGKGFEVTVKFSVTGNNENILNSIKQDANNAILVKTDKDEVINNESLKIEKAEDWTSIEGGYAITYKISCDNVYNYISNKDINSVLVGLKISYVDPYSISNILILRTDETNGAAKRLQDFVTFLNGNLDKYTNVAISFENEQKNVCRPTFTMPCTTQENVYYLIEGTQSGALYNTIMNGIKNVGDLQNLMSDAYNMLAQLKNINLTDLGKNDLKIIMGVLENFVNNGAILKTINNELGNYLSPLANNGNKTAKALLSAINSVSFSNDAQTNFQNLTSVFISTLLNVLPNGVDNVSKEWDEIVKTLKTGVENQNVSENLYGLMENLGNAIKNSGSSLGNILKGVDAIANYFKNNENFKNVTDIESAITAVEATIQSVITDGTQKLNGFLENLKNMTGQLDPTKLLTSVGNWNIFETISNALIVDWEKCIIGEDGIEATDPNGNSYTIQQSNDNDYGMFCTITCKEDYAVKMPGNLGTTYVGRYISTNVDNVYHATIGIAGQRTCVTTEIKNDKYVESAKTQKDAMLKAYNDFYDSYAQYKELKGRENNDSRSHDAYIQSSADPMNIEEIKSKLVHGLQDAVQNTFSQFVSSVLPNEDAEAVKNQFATDSATIISKIAMMAISGELSGDGLKDTFSNYFKEKLEQYQARLEGAISSFIPNLLNNCQAVAKDILGETGGNALGLVGKTALQFTCNEAADALMGVFGIGEIIKGVCGAYSSVTTTVANAIIGVNKASQHKIFQIEYGINYSYTYHKYVYSDASTPEKILASKFVEGTDADSTVSGNKTTAGNETTIWVMKNEGRFVINDLKYGSVVFRAASQISKVTQSLQKMGNLNILQSGNFENQLKALVESAKNLSGSFSYSWLKKNGGSLSADGFSGIVDMITNIMGIFTDMSGVTDNVLTGVTDAVDTALLVYYDFLGIFNPYYAALGDLRHKMEDSKDEYYAAQTELVDLANRMNACTMWSNTYEFDPQIEFTYGLSGYFVNKNDKTTDKVNLKAINKGEAENISYYCDGDVAINDIQNWDVITSGKCRTDDGMIGGILSSLAGEDSTLNKILETFKENSTGLKKLLSNSKVKEAIQNTGYGEQIGNFLCSGLGESFCNIFGTNDDDSLVTFVPGNIVYKAILSDGTTDTSSGVQSWKGLLGVIGSGSLSFDNVISNITNKVTYSTGAGSEINYRNVGRVVNISRYGNPGVSISGLSWTSILSNMASYISSKTGTDVINKLNNGIMSITGQGAQEFIYFKSSQSYWTSSNKGIYTKTKAATDSVLVDTGDPALTDDKYVSGTSEEKKADGLVYPIALSTSEGSYKYQIKINNVGQYYNNTTSLGRIIDDSGYVNGLLANQYVCKYEVETEPPTPNVPCEEILESSDCKDENGYFKDLYKNQNYDKTNGIDYEAKWNACITKLLAENNSCCYLIDANNVPNASQDRYNSMCNSKCQGIKLYGSDSAIKDSSTSSSALISKNGVLQFYTKVISNYDYFPNGEGSKGFNWSGKTSGYENVDESGNPVSQDINTIINNKEEIGDGIYGDDEKYLNYSINISSACMAKIKEYNDQQELNDLGFGDYTGGIENVKTREYRSQFLKDLEESSEYAVCREKPIINQLQK